MVLVLVRQGQTEGDFAVIAGVLLVALGLSLRLWAVRHIGDISRTRANRHGPLQTTGPYAVVRNPLYCANWLLWTGFAAASGLTWMLPVAWLMFGLQYGAIVAWEENLMSERFGEEYDRYTAAVPRWLPTLRTLRNLSSAPMHPWRDVLFSERGTLIAAGFMIVLLAIKDAVT